MIVYNRYVGNKDHTWYDSSNIMYSLCYDNNVSEKTLKVVFKNGRTYVYRNVDVNDYILFKNSDSQGKAIHEHIIKKYKGVRIADTDMDELSSYKDTLINEVEENGQTKMSDVVYHIDMNPTDGQFQLKLNGKVLYTGEENKVSIVNLFRSMNINYSWNTVDEINSNTDENEDKIIFD